MDKASSLNKQTANKETSLPLPALEAHLGYWLRRVSNPVSSAFARLLEERQVTVAEWVALRHLYDRQDVTPGELAQALGMTRGAISKILDKLEAKGWLARMTPPEDRRVQRLSLTPHGENILPVLAALAESNDWHFFDCLSVEEQSALRTLLQKLAVVHHWNESPVE